ncbi:MAG: hypothetical protein FJY88_00975 [Candidatus Eisenbacteria bacterium]|nr:hypothetical protein [Candidatus Eisenbacteria bacterium]
MRSRYVGLSSGLVVVALAFACLPAVGPARAEATASAGRHSAAGADLAGRPAEILSWRHQILAPEQYQRLAAEWEAYVQKHPTDARAIVEWGDALRYCGKREEAVNAYAIAYQTDSTDAAAITAHVQHGICGDYENADWNRAKRMYMRAVESDPTYPDTYYMLWFTALRTGDSALAGKCLARTVELGDMPRPLVDFGYNMLAGAPENAIVLTNGDNDTYPPLAVQSTIGFRTDVSIVNLSLLNVKWYIRHLRDAGVPFGLDDRAIEKLQHAEGKVISMQAQEALLASLRKGRSPRPLLYAASVMEQNRALKGPSRVDGLLEWIVEAEQTPRAVGEFDLDHTRILLDRIYRLDGITDPLIDWERENSVAKLGLNYVVLLSKVGEGLLAENRPPEAAPYLLKAVSILAFHDRPEKAREVVEVWRKTDPGSPLLAEALRLIERADGRAAPGR